MGFSQNIRSVFKHWWGRHLIVIGFSIVCGYGFWLIHNTWVPMHLWNRVFGDTSVVLLALTMVIGPGARIWPKLQASKPWRRELGIYAVILASVHLIILFDGWFKWDLMVLVGYVVHPAFNDYVLDRHGLGLANILGVVALLYGLVLMLTSNDLSQTVLRSTWKFVQLGSYTLWALVVVHTGYFLYLHFVHYHRPDPEPNVLQWPFAGLVGLVLIIQFVATLRTWKNRQESRAPS
ncbi:MAG: hypothetical protein COB59_04580 [Rhodospirillaceae bacterium]|nr:MAG: hypothetical protein COB59_04580 [Rhodospirillaceae bacterium]